MENKIQTKDYLSPCGMLTLGALDGALCMCDWNVGLRRETIDRRLCREFITTMESGDNDVLRMARKELDEFFSGMRQTFDTPIVFAGSELRQAVWSELQKITYGQTVSYAEMARRIGRPKAVRAVASAVGANPLSIFIPCHRVIGSNGSLTGYAGGLDAKQMLLSFENKITEKPQLFGSW